MQWCNCNNDDFIFNLSNIENDINAPVRCYSCGNRVDNETLIILLLRETIKLKEFIITLEEEKMKREREEYEEKEQERKELEKMDSEADRFTILDL